MGEFGESQPSRKEIQDYINMLDGLEPTGDLSEDFGVFSAAAGFKRDGPLAGLRRQIQSGNVDGALELLKIFAHKKDFPSSDMLQQKFDAAKSNAAQRLLNYYSKKK